MEQCFYARACRFSCIILLLLLLLPSPQKLATAFTFSANCFWKLFKHRKVKQDTSNGEQVYSDTGKSSGFPNGRCADIAATQIQTAFRAFTARKITHCSKGPLRFQDLVQGETGTKQMLTALSFIHSWSRMQQEIRARRICMVTEYRIKQKKLENQLKLEAKLQELEVEWCGGSETMEEILSKIKQREEASVRRERAMAYAFSHQWRANSLQLSPASYSLDKENWGWSWKQRWIAARPWEVRAHAHPTIPKKVQSKQTSKSDKAPNGRPELKLSNSARHSLSNGKDSSKARNSALPNC